MCEVKQAIIVKETSVFSKTVSSVSRGKQVAHMKFSISCLVTLATVGLQLNAPTPRSTNTSHFCTSGAVESCIMRRSRATESRTILPQPRDLANVNRRSEGSPVAPRRRRPLSKQPERLLVVTEFAFGTDLTRRLCVPQEHMELQGRSVFED